MRRAAGTQRNLTLYLPGISPSTCGMSTRLMAAALEARVFPKEEALCLSALEQGSAPSLPPTSSIGSNFKTSRVENGARESLETAEKALNYLDATAVRAVDAAPSEGRAIAEQPASCARAGTLSGADLPFPINLYRAEREANAKLTVSSRTH